MKKASLTVESRLFHIKKRKITIESRHFHAKKRKITNESPFFSIRLTKNKSESAKTYGKRAEKRGRQGKMSAHKKKTLRRNRKVFQANTATRTQYLIITSDVLCQVSYVGVSAVILAKIENMVKRRHILCAKLKGKQYICSDLQKHHNLIESRLWLSLLLI